MANYDTSSERSNSDIYWAAEPAFSNDIGNEILKRLEEYLKYLKTTGRINLYRRSYDYYYPAVVKNGRLTKSGDQGQFTNITINDYRNLGQNLCNITMQQKPEFEPRAANSDYKSQAQTILAGQILDYYQTEKHWDRYIRQSLEDQYVFGEGFVELGWDSTLGDAYTVDPATGRQINQGDIYLHNYCPLDIARDYTRDTPDDDWVICRRYVNRYDLAAKYPDLREKILQVPSLSNLERTDSIMSFATQGSDLIPLITMYHKRTPAMPNGRRVVMTNDSELIFEDGNLPYKSIPVFRIVASNQRGSIFGYSIGFDLLQIQEAENILHSTILTNQVNFGVQSVLCPRGAGLTAEHVGNGGLNMIYYDQAKGKPEPLNLTSTPAEVFNYLGILGKCAETISGVNSVARGNPESSLKSGSALALVQSMATQFTMNLQDNYATLIEDLGTHLIDILKEYATIPRIAAIAGKANVSMLKEFTGNDLKDITRVTVDIGNPLTRTTAGKVNLADALLQHGFIQDPQEYLMVVQTGQLDPLIHNQTAELLLIRSENEAMQDGSSPVVAILTDDHHTHILEHTSVLSDPSARQDGQLVQRVLQHIQEHMDILGSPALANTLIVLGQHPIAPPGMPQMMPGGPPPGPPGAPPGHNPNQPKNPGGNPNVAGARPGLPHTNGKPPRNVAERNSIPQQLNATNPITQKAATVNLPNIPAARPINPPPLT